MNFTTKEEANTKYGQVSVHIESDPILGYVPDWANAAEIAREVHLMIEKRHMAFKQQEKDNEMSRV